MAARRAYQIVERIEAASDVSIYRAVRTADQRPVMLKVLEHVRARPRDLAHLRNELEIAKPLDTSAALKPLGIESYDGGTALVLEDFRGVSLQRLIGAPMAIDLFLSLAVRMAAAIDEVHARGVIHKNIKPSSFLVTEGEGEIDVRIVDFGLACRLPREHQEIGPPRLLEGTLPYLAPEQTGRMNRVVDARSDLYGLGVTFFEMLTGQLPFSAQDPLEWVHCHLARAPTPPGELVPSVPGMLSRIVVRLLAKHAEARYQSAAGLEHDLARCRDAWRATGEIEPFPLGEADTSERFRIPQMLYGRGPDLDALHAAFARVREGSHAEAVMVSGPSGIGKSALVHELLRSIVAERGVFLEGKFELYKRNTPYHSIFRAFATLGSELLSESASNLARWQRRLRDALGGTAGIITGAIPEMERVLGPQPPVPELPPDEAERRLHRTFTRFIGAVAGPDHPVVLFLDDLQWTDRASLRLLEHVLAHADRTRLLLIGGYRSEEVSESHPLPQTLARVRDAGVPVEDVLLGPLSSHQVAELVADTVHRSVEEAWPLAELIREKTLGNPFFTIQFLTALAEQDMLVYDRQTRGWKWDLARIRTLGHTDNVVDLMVARLGRLPEATQRECMLAACIGDVCDASTLSALSERSEETLHRVLHSALVEGLLSRSGDRYRFAHDRVQQAAYSMIHASERPAIHLQIGRLLLERAPPERRDERIFEVADQINRGRAALPERERAWAAEINLRAGDAARRAAAYANASAYLDCGVELLVEDAWSTSYRLAFELHLERARCEYLQGHFDAAERMLDETMEHAATRIDAAAVWRTRIELETTRDRHAQAVERGIACLAELGIELSAAPTWAEVTEAYEAVRARMGGREIEELIDLPPMRDPTIRAAMDVLAVLNSPALFTNLNCYYLIGCRMVELSILHGNSDSSCAGYAIFAYLPGPGFNRYEEGSRFGRLGYDLVQHRGLIGEQPKVLHDYGAVAFFTEPVRTARALVGNAFEQSIQTGDLVYACYGAALTMALDFERGDSLDQLDEAAEYTTSVAQNAGFIMIEALVAGQRRLIDRLRGTAGPTVRVGGEVLRIDAFEARLRVDPGWTIAACWAFVYRLWADVLLGDIPSALEAAAEADERMSVSHSFPPVADHRFFHSLALASGDVTPDAIATIERHEEQFRVWTAASPSTFGARHALICAELARLKRRELEAIDQYELAIRRSVHAGIVHTEAVSCERAARFYFGRGQHEIANLYLRRARGCYVRWGADAKVAQLERDHPELIARPPPTEERIAVSVEQLDLLSVVRASQAISREIVLDALVPTLLRLTVELAGAQRGALILVREDELRLEAEAALEPGGVVVTRLPSLPAERSDAVPVSVITYAWRSGERVVLEDAVHAERFGNDPYIARERPLSVLCIPVVRQDEVIALIELESRATTGAPERLAAVEVLAAQAAISLENALLVEREQARRSEAEAAERRTAFLAEATVLLGSSLEYERVLADLCRLCVRTLGDWCIIDLIEDGELRRALGSHADPEREGLLEILRVRYPPSPHALVPAAAVQRTGRSVLLPHLTAASIRARCQDDEHARIVMDLGTRSVLAVPLSARGRTFGVLTLASSAADGVEYGASDLSITEELGRRAGIAIDNARLYRDAQRAIRLRDEFLSIASHELRTPLTALRLTVESTRDSELTPEQMAPLLDRMERQATRLTRLVGALLEVTRIEAGKLELSLEEVDLSALVREVASELAMELRRIGSELRLRADRPVVGRWDPLRIEQAVINLLTNAIKFGQGRPIDVTVEARPEGAVIAVRDHGIGISHETQARLFQRFARGVSSRHYGGLGLGLYISRTIAEAHGGTIDVESEPDQGTTFTIRLPFSR